MNKAHVLQVMCMANCSKNLFRTFKVYISVCPQYLLGWQEVESGKKATQIPLKFGLRLGVRNNNNLNENMNEKKVLSPRQLRTFPNKYLPFAWPGL